MARGTRRRWSLAGGWAVFGLLVTILTVASACSSTSAEGVDTGTGMGGSGGATTDASGDAPKVDANPTGIPFGCGQVQCVTGETFCEMSTGGSGGMGGTAPDSYRCLPFTSNCAPHDCSCRGIYACGDCSQLPSGGILSVCRHV